jgi:CheY-like chemotaxis protein/two-component sensor histidine kinase
MEAVGQLTGGIAHDFNNLLMAILSSLEMIKKRLPDDPWLHRLLDNAVQAAERGSSVTQRMLSFARRQDLNTQAVDVAALVSGVTGLLQGSLGPTVVISQRMPAGLPPVMTDSNQLETALLNLMVNARDAMPNGGPIEITARAESVGPGFRLKPGDYVCLSVADRGEGMDAQTLARATEPFFTTKGVGKGTGLGLSMVHGLAEQSGGALVLRSAPNKGTTVELWLPVAASPAAPAGRASTPVLPEKPRTLKVLAVDDDALVLMNTAAMLEDLGHTPIEATSAAAALELLRQHTDVDVVITDHVMPGMTGSALARSIRQTWPELPIVLATGYAELPEGQDIGLPRLAKPFLQADLARVLAKVAAGKSSVEHA